MWAFTSHKSMNELDSCFWPHWATGMAGNICIGAQLCTRDGRRTGNAVVTGWISDKDRTWEVLTDAGNTLVVNEEEISALFYYPRWTMAVDSCPGRQYQSGADHELEACRQLLEINKCPSEWIDLMMSFRRPKPPSLKQQATTELDDAVMRGDCITVSDVLPILRRVIEALPE
jgi:hypothetical protein